MKRNGKGKKGGKERRKEGKRSQDFERRATARWLRFDVERSSERKKGTRRERGRGNEPVIAWVNKRPSAGFLYLCARLLQFKLL